MYFPRLILCVVLLLTSINAMTYQSDDLLRVFSNLPGASGFEGPVRSQLIRYLEQMNQKFQIDGMGNVLVRFPAKKNALKILIMAHMDEVGFLTQEIDERGFIRVVSLGGWLDQVLWDQEWEIHTDKMTIPAISGIDPPHVLTDFTKSPKVNRGMLFLDTGLSKKELIQQGVRPGLPVTAASSFKKLSNGLYSGKAFDDRVGLALMIELIDTIRKENHNNANVEIQFAATTQEELGMRGSKVVYASLKPDLVINLEAGIAHDYPEQFSTNKTPVLGKGPALFVYDKSMIPNQGLVKRIAEIAEQNKIPFQWEIENSYGEDASCLQTSGLGVASINLGVPIRYVHSHHGVMVQKDYDLTLKLLFAILHYPFLLKGQFYE